MTHVYQKVRWGLYFPPPQFSGCTGPFRPIFSFMLFYSNLSGEYGRENADERAHAWRKWTSWLRKRQLFAATSSASLASLPREAFSIQDIHRIYLPGSTPWRHNLKEFWRLKVQVDPPILGNGSAIVSDTDRTCLGAKPRWRGSAWRRSRPGWRRGAREDHMLTATYDLTAIDGAALMESWFRQMWSRSFFGR